MNPDEKPISDSLPAGNDPDSDTTEQACPGQAGSAAPGPIIFNLPPKSAVLPDEPVNARIGSYKLLQQIGVGGFGTVYMAEQEEPIRRRVALKIINLGMDTRQIIARFEAERQALALMDHPNITKVLDAGATEAGRPYFVMELVRGIKITDYCDQNKLSTEDRLALFNQVCQAIQHAHQKGIIHRDIKPSNILVTLHDGVPVPKVIDFGIAKAIQQPLTDKTLFTRFEEFLGTPIYMSPEQTDLGGLDLDTRTDIYSLGVLLYELLTGSTPFVGQELVQAGLAEVRRIIREVEPPRPSTRLSTQAAGALSTAASHRHTDPPKLIRRVRGELDWIVMKCLEKDRTRRYETASALALDVRHHLQNEPVTAAAPSSGYRFKKFVRRNKVSLATVTAMVLLLAAGTVVSAWQAVKATRAEKHAESERDRARVAEQDSQKQRNKAVMEKQRADEQAKIAEGVSDFLRNDILRQADSRAQIARKFTAEPNLTVRQAVDRATDRIGNRFKDQPLVEAEIRHTIGYVYLGVGEVKLGVPQFEKSFDIIKSKLGLEHPDTLIIMNELAEAYKEAGRSSEAIPLFQDVLKIREKTLGPEHIGVGISLVGLAIMYAGQGQYASAEPLFKRALVIAEKVQGPDSPNVAATLRHLALLYHAQKQYASAEPMYKRSLVMVEKALGPDHPNVAQSLQSLADLYLEQRQYASAEPLFKRSLAIREKILGPEHPDVAYSLIGLAAFYQAQNQYVAAEPLLQRALTIREKALGLKHPHVAQTLNNLGVFYQTQKQYASAESFFKRALASTEAFYGLEHTNVAFRLRNLASFYSDQRRYALAEPLYHRALAIREKSLGPEHPDTLTTVFDLANVYDKQGKYADAEILYRELLEIRKKQKGDDSSEAALAQSNLGSNLILQKKCSEAESLLRNALETSEIKMTNDWRLFNTRSILGAALVGQMKFAEAEPLLISGYQGMKQREHKIPATNKGNLSAALRRLVALYTDWNKPDQVAEWQLKLEESSKAQKTTPPR